MAKSKKQTSTQKFIEIQDIKEDVVLLPKGEACMVIEIEATNFDLLSMEEQQAKIGSYAALLNSLSFPIQILIRNKRVDVTTYLKYLDDESQKIQNDRLASFVQQYKAFVQEMIKVNTVLDKKFYMIIPFSPLEKGATAVLQQGDLFAQAKAALHSKAEGMLTQLARLSLRAKSLDNAELIQLFYDVYNPDQTEVAQTEAVDLQPVATFAR